MVANDKTAVLHGSLAPMALQTLDKPGPQHGWGIASERTSDIAARFLKPSGETS
jgi:hypothetical protein